MSMTKWLYLNNSSVQLITAAPYIVHHVHPNVLRWNLLFTSGMKDLGNFTDCRDDLYSLVNIYKMPTNKDMYDSSWFVQSSVLMTLDVAKT